jgi:hypothetical protein
MNYIRIQQIHPEFRMIYTLLQTPGAAGTLPKGQDMKLAFDPMMTKAGLLGALILIAACTKPIDRAYATDGAQSPQFSADLASCKSLARQQRARHGEAAVVGAAGGALAGALDNEDDARDGALAGAAIGAVIGAASAESDMNDARRQMVINCMIGRGHQVIG